MKADPVSSSQHDHSLSWLIDSSVELRNTHTQQKIHIGSLHLVQYKKNWRRRRRRRRAPNPKTKVQLDSVTILGIKTSLTEAEETHHRLLEITSQKNPKQPVETEAYELGHHLHEEQEEERDRQRSAVWWDVLVLVFCEFCFVFFGIVYFPCINFLRSFAADDRIASRTSSLRTWFLKTHLCQFSSQFRT